VNRRLGLTSEGRGNNRNNNLLDLHGEVDFWSSFPPPKAFELINFQTTKSSELKPGSNEILRRISVGLSALLWKWDFAFKRIGKDSSQNGKSVESKSEKGKQKSRSLKRNEMRRSHESRHESFISSIFFPGSL